MIKWCGIIVALIYSVSTTSGQGSSIPDTDLIMQLRGDKSLSVGHRDSILAMYRDQALALGKDSLAAFIQHSMAVVHYNNDRHIEAYRHYVKALGMWRRLPDTLHVDIMRTALYAGISARNSGQTEAAKRHFQEVFEHPRHRYFFRAYHQMANTLLLEGNYTLAQDYFDQAFLGSSWLHLRDRIELRIDHMKLHIDQNDTTSLLSAIESNMAFFREFLASYQGKSDDLSHFCQHLAILYRMVGDIENCVRYNIVAAHYAAHDVNLADILNNLNNVLRESGAVDSAELYVNQARNIFNKLDDPLRADGLAATSDNLGEIYLKRKEYAKALLHFDSALYFKTGSDFTVVGPEFAVFSAEKKIRIARYLSDKARGLYQWYQADGNVRHLDDALQCYSDADQMIDLIRRSLAHDDAHIHWRGQARDIYVPAVQVAIDAGEPETALRYIDRSKALVLTEALQKSRNAEIIPSAVREAEAQLARQINSAEQKVRKLETGTDNTVLLRTRDTLLNLQDQYVALNDRILRDFPDYFPTYNFDISEIQRELPGNMCILSYFLTPDTVICARVDRHAVDVRSLCSRVQLDALLDTLHDLWADMEHGAAVGNAMSGSEYKDHLKTLAATCSALHEALLKPWGELPQRVMIIGDGRLNGLNFELLLTDKPDAETPLRRWPFAIQKHCFSYNHSIANWREMLGNESRIHQVVGIAPDFDAPYQALPYSQKGLENIRGFRLNILRGSEANRTRLAQHGRRAILDFQTHAVINEIDSEESFIVLNNEDGGMDSLYLSDIYHFEFPGSFAVLTACETHVGEIARGEGVISLARAFTYAGASSMITSLWKVDDLVSSQIIHRMYQGLSSGLEKDVALNRAKLQYLDNTQDERQEHPFYWASLVPLGSTAPVNDPGKWWSLLLFGVFLGGLFAWVVSGSVKSHPVPNAA